MGKIPARGLGVGEKLVLPRRPREVFVDDGECRNPSAGPADENSSAEGNRSAIFALSERTPGHFFLALTMAIGADDERF